MSESATKDVEKTEQTGEKKTRKVLTPEEIFKEQKELLNKRKERMRNEQFQNVKSQKLIAEALLTKIAKKFNIKKVEDIDFNFIENLSLTDEKESDDDKQKTSTQSKVDENQLKLGQVISNLFPQKSMSADDMFNEVNLWKNAYDVLTKQLGTKVTKEMIPRLENFVATQDINGQYFSNAMHGKKNIRTVPSEEKKT